jgi:hypothetical protein
MTRREFQWLCALTLAAVLAAAVARLAQAPADRLDLDGARAFPELEARLESVARIEVATPETTFALARAGEGWVAASEHGYPARPARANKLLVELATLELLAPKTAQPDLYHRLAVGPVDAPGSRARRVTLRDAAGAVLADLIVGKQRHARTGRRDRGTYVRRPDAARSYLAAGFIDLSDTVYPWLRSKVLDVAPERVRKVEIRTARGPRLLAIRPEPGVPAMGLAGVPPGARPSIAAVRKLPHVLEGVRFEAVEPAAGFALPPPVALATVETFDGLRVAVRVHQRMTTYWLTARASAMDGAGESVADEVAALAPRLDGWAFQVADYLGARLSQSLDDVL